MTVAPPGTLQLSYTNLTEGEQVAVICNAVVSVDDTIHTSLSVTPIVTYPAKSAFIFDTGTTENITFRIKRINPDPTVIDDLSPDSRLWSNRKWKKAITDMADRWQARTDGVKLSFTPTVQSAPGVGLYQASINENGYIKSLSITYDISSFELLTVELTIAIGSMGAEIGGI